MDKRIENYEVCLPDWGAVLPELATLLSAEYSGGQFEAAEDAFCDSGRDSAEWSMIGANGLSVTIIFEKYEGYLFGTIKGCGQSFSKAKLLLYSSYISQGGNPNAQARP
ncbi:MAG: hypothetical protein GY930_07255, partial [bacterium]|nr:hypothetical protein [bacterium]